METLFSVYGQRVITDWQVLNWSAMFHSGETFLEDEPIHSHSMGFGTEALKSLMESRLWQSTQELAKI